MGFLITFNACSVAKNAVDETKSVAAKAINTNAACFVQFKDGKIVNYQSLQLVNAVFNDAYLLADGKLRLYPKDIKSYQTGNYYAVSQTIFANGRKSRVAIDCLPGFAIRIAKGKLNIYCKQFYNGAHAVDEFYLQSGEDGPIVVYAPKLMEELLKGNEAAAAWFKANLKKTALHKNLQATVALVNKESLLSKN